MTSNIGDYASLMGLPTTYIGRAIPEHVKEPRAPVDKSKVLKPGTTGQIPQLLRLVYVIFNKFRG